MTKHQSIGLTSASAALLIGLTGNANAANIIYDFDANDGVVTTNDFSGDLITVTDVVIGGLHPTYSAFADGHFGRRLRNDPATLTFTISIPATVVLDLTSLSFLGGIDSQPTSTNETFAQWDLTMDTGSGDTVSWTEALTGQGTVSSTRTSNLTGLTGLTNQDVTFIVTSYYGTVNTPPPTGGNNPIRFATFDDLTFNGTSSPVPEPSSTALLGLGGLALILRRRRK